MEITNDLCHEAIKEINRYLRNLNDLCVFLDLADDMYDVMCVLSHLVGDVCPAVTQMYQIMLRLAPT